MKILIFGASGGTGRHLVSLGLKKGFEVTAFVRTSTESSPQNNRLKTITGDVLDARRVKEAIAGHDVIISALGKKRYDLTPGDTSISQGLKNIIAGMKESQVKRLVFITSFGVSKNIFFPEKILLNTVLKNLFADNFEQESLIKRSELDWTIVRPARLVDQPPKGNYQIGENLYIGPFSKISRADVADFIIKSINNPQSIKRIFTIKY